MRCSSVGYLVDSLWAQDHQGVVSGTDGGLACWVPELHRHTVALQPAEQKRAPGRCCWCPAAKWWPAWLWLLPPP